jgi:hypothetical protein
MWSHVHNGFEFTQRRVRFKAAFKITLTARLSAALVSGARIVGGWNQSVNRPNLRNDTRLHCRRDSRQASGEGEQSCTMQSEGPQPLSGWPVSC